MVVEEEKRADRLTLVGRPLVQTPWFPLSFHVNLGNERHNKSRYYEYRKQGLEIARTAERPRDAAGVSDQTGTMEGIK